MNVSKSVRCAAFPCTDVQHQCYVVPDIDVKREKTLIIMISEAAPAFLGDYYYAKGDPLFQRTTVQAFNDAGANVASIQDIVQRRSLGRQRQFRGGYSRWCWHHARHALLSAFHFVCSCVR